MESFLACSTHFKILMSICSKAEHGLRAKDIDNKDKQNFAAVEHLIRATPLLKNMPDAFGTICYMNVMSATIDSFLDRKLSPAKRLQTSGLQLLTKVLETMDMLTEKFYSKKLLHYKNYLCSNECSFPVITYFDNEG